jgi:hypothetical protein
MIERDDIIRMAVEAGYGDAMSDLHAPALERFANLVAAYEREEVTKQIQAEINHLKTQLMRYNTNDGAYKAAFLAGQMAARGPNNG